MKLKFIFLASLVLIAAKCKKDSTIPKNEVYISGQAFVPETLSVSAGTTVKWTVKEDDMHTVTTDSILFDSKDLTKDMTFSFQFKSAGSYTYHCNHHSQMKGTIIVK